jgi:transcriptional regulator GlxA family with amidase domain
MRLEPTVVPRDVKRAIAYMDATLDATIALSDIVAAAGVAGRTLFKHFRDFKGTTPLRYLRDARLDRVRQALQQAADGETVTGLAWRWGFNHMGRFSVDYRRRFGECPSQTLCRGRRLRDEEAAWDAASPAVPTSPSRCAATRPSALGRSG